jgi:hypothetical protein
MKRLFILFFLVMCFTLTVNAQTVQINTPEKHFGFKPGADRMLFDYENLIDYMQHLDKTSERFKLVEVGPAQAVPLIAYELVTTQCPVKTQWLKNVVLTMVPCHNPDGMDMVVNHYKKYIGTKYEGSSMPGIYHKYVGHDNNRDFVTLSQSDNRAVASVYNLEWFPQVLVEKHEMKVFGPVPFHKISP